MLDKFFIWFYTYYDEITWFLIGWLTMSGFDSLSRGFVGSAFVDFLLAFINYMFWKRR